MSPALRSFLDRLVELVGTGDVLELGSHPGLAADYLEDQGCTRPVAFSFFQVACAGVEESRV